jgi:3-hydroxymyristoyl/3-hydroxydecanoyl-(acyl carrier protein) dehydratase
VTRIGQFTVPPDHPSLPGHFPGRPIVPGVVLLDAALALILDHLPHAGLVGIVAGKFTAVVLPGQVVEVSCAAPAGERLDFSCGVGGRVVAHGTLRLTGATASPETHGWPRQAQP